MTKIGICFMECLNVSIWYVFGYDYILFIAKWIKHANLKINHIQLLPPPKNKYKDIYKLKVNEEDSLTFLLYISC